MSIKNILAESLEKNPLGLQEAVVQELNSRIAAVLEAKMAKCDDDDKDQKEDEEAVEKEKEEEGVDESIRHYRKASTIKKPHVVGGLGDEKSDEPYVYKHTAYGKYKVRKSQAEMVPEETQLESSAALEEDNLEEVLDTPKARKSYLDKALKSADTAVAAKDKKTLAKRDRGLGLSYDKGIRKDVQKYGKLRRDMSGEHNWNEEVGLEERNAENKLKKNIHTAEIGNKADITRSNYSSKDLKPLSSRSKGEEGSHENTRSSLKNAISKMLRAGRAELKHGKDAGFIKTLNDFGKNVRKEEVELEEEVLKYGKEYVDNKINSGEWKFLQGARRPGGVFTVKDVENNKVMAIMYDTSKK